VKDEENKILICKMKYQFKTSVYMMLIYVRALYNTCFIIPTSAQFF